VGGEPDLKMNRSIVVAQAMPMEHFFTLLMRTGRVPVVDLTGLLGRYDFSFDWAKYVTPDTPPDEMFAALCQALQQEFGSRVEARKLPLEVLALDHVAAELITGRIHPCLAGFPAPPPRSSPPKPAS
jgi:uncharacterized protein (TIGR03435 family)